MGRRRTPATDGLARQRPRGHRRSGRAARAGGRAGAVDRRGHRSRLRPRPPGDGHRDPEDDLLDMLDAAAAVVAGARAGRRPGRYSFAHALIQHTMYEDLGPDPPGPCAPTGRGGAGGALRRPTRAPGGRTGPALDQRHPARSTWPRRSTTPARRATPPSPRSPPPTRSATSLRPSSSTLEADDPDPVLELDLAIGLGTAQRQTGDPAFRDTLLDAARQAAELGDTERLVAAALANDRGFYSAVGATDVEKVEILEQALDCSPPTTPTGRSCSPPCARSSPTAARSSAARLSPTKPSPSPSRPATTPSIVRVLNHVFTPAPGAAPARLIARPDHRRPGPRRTGR